MLTATRATDSVDSSSRTNEDRKAKRSVFMVSVRCAASVRRRPTSWARARPNTCSVGSPATRSAKWLARRVSTAKRRSTCFWVAMPIRAMNRGMSGTVIAMMMVDSRSWVRIATPTTSGTPTAIMSCGRYLEK
ncbi:hypothetical protein MAJHIDBO_00131 [Propionibacterium freudenreichii subsp. shermanii]|nr:hypothetical protein MAJHIDBO_00131 [Propionibacterium freudenreichii subsp. shermanii]SPS07820.1 hypothetical protein MAJHIDBO_00131 [Propionibacterium freudenreichii subsp. shermanii]